MSLFGNTQQSLGRVVNLKVYGTIFSSSGGEPVIDYNAGTTTFSSIQPDGKSGYRIKGKVVIQQQTIGFSSNPIILSIYNLGKNSRSLIESKIGTKIEILAGYSSNPQSIGVGNVLWAKTHKDRSDYITEVIVGDGHFGMVNGLINISFSGPVTYLQCVLSLVSALTNTGIIAGVINVPNGSFNNGNVFTGSPLKALSDLCQKIGCTMTFRSNTINIVPVGTDLGFPALNVSTQTGMVGIPEVHPPGVIGTVNTAQSATVQNSLSFKHLLRPEIGINQLVNITSEFVNGKYVTARVVHDFDSWDGPFYTECECFAAGSAFG